MTVKPGGKSGLAAARGPRKLHQLLIPQNLFELVQSIVIGSRQVRAAPLFITLGVHDVQLSLNVHSTVREPYLAVLDPVQDVRYVGMVDGQNDCEDIGLFF